MLRIKDGDNPLDYTGVHPESYQAAQRLLEKMKITPQELLKGPSSFLIRDYAVLAEELGIGEPTLRDIVKELSSPGRDPRDEMPRPILRTDVMNLEDLKPGMILKGTVRNVIDFGAFVDIGVHHDGLVHISEMANRYIEHPLEAVSVGDIVDVRVLSVDVAKERIALSMKLEETSKENRASQAGGERNSSGKKGQGQDNRKRQGQGSGSGQKSYGQDDRKRQGQDNRKSQGRGSEQKNHEGSMADNRRKREDGGVKIPNRGIFAGKRI